ncbi:GNAT family N-acetyltransferase [Rhodobacteraceae bacterium N5(2021)]|uniref:GNAT family N-acetyltransferase n=1 Tax=Gymnodinialimonas phycosphaerae TaxID=2841589 RepID=A0A975TTP5_9RHOB|nr:GNAT family N-acetyltransferase [Gymnodinialimonas phycosphaerae]MBY4893906.1 GNAT family N-acetyltransferase [Gymnodinialimonas phycosphaerae]
MTIPIRKARPEDAKVITALVRAAYTPWIDEIGATPGPMLDDYAKLVAEKWVGVSEDDNGIFTVMVLLDQGDTLLLDNMAVRPDMQGKGWGRRLLESADTIASEAGFSRIRLYTHEKMKSNIAMYERHGYTMTHRVTEKGLDRVYMEKAVKPWPGRPRPKRP